MRTINELIATPHSRPLVIAHRGASYYHHENTMEAYETAVEMHAEMLEIDVRRTSDRVLVIHHDSDYAGQEIKASTKGGLVDREQISGYKVPALTDALEFCANKIPVDIELKEAGYEEEVLEEVTNLLKPDQFIVTSMHDSVVRKVKHLDPDIRTGLIISSRPYRQLITKLYPGFRTLRAKADVLIVSRKLLKFGILSTTRNLGLPIWVYTVNDRKELWRMISDERISGIFTDRPDVALFLRDLLSVGQPKTMPE